MEPARFDSLLNHASEVFCRLKQQLDPLQQTILNGVMIYGHPRHWSGEQFIDVYSADSLLRAPGWGRNNS